MIHKLTFQWGTPGQSGALSGAISQSAAAERNLDVTIPSSANGTAIDFQLTVARAKILVILATAAMVLKTNNHGTPVNTITLQANEPFVWVAGQGTLQDTAAVNMSDITHLYVDSTPGGSLSIRSLYDPAG